MKLGKLEYHTAQSSSLWLLVVCLFSVHLALVNLTLKQEGTAPSVETALCFSLRRAFEVHDPVRFMLQEWIDSGCVALVAWCFYMFTDLIRLSIQYIPISVPNEKPELSPRGHLCLCYSCPCLPSYTSGSFHWEKDAGSGATLQIPPGCGICNKQPRAMAAALSLLTPGTPPEVTSALFISFPNNLYIMSSLV